MKKDNNKWCSLPHSKTHNTKDCFVKNGKLEAADTKRTLYKRKVESDKNYVFKVNFTPVKSIDAGGLLNGENVELTVDTGATKII